MSTMLWNWTPRKQTETVVVIISEAHHITNVIRVKTAGNSNFTLLQIVYFSQRLLSPGFLLNA
jgi:hypothetical protein